jgi:hypothetical protein
MMEPWKNRTMGHGETSETGGTSETRFNIVYILSTSRLAQRWLYS